MKKGNGDILKRIMKKKYELLKKEWGYNSFRGKQEELIDSVLQLKDSFGQFPTGMGKSICFQLPALMFNGTTVVISPFVALMRDQVEDLEGTKIKVAYLNSTLEKGEKMEIINQIISGELKMIYISPERFCNDWFIDMLNEIPISMIVIDEAHLVYQSAQFRPEFAEIGNYINLLKEKQEQTFKNRGGKIVTMALTATANPKIRENIINSLNMNSNTNIVKMEYKRDNLIYYSKFYTREREKEKALVKVCKILKGVKGVKMVFGIARKEVENLSKILKTNGLKADYYHADMTKKRKESVYQKFLKDKIDYICCTSAFGTGINKDDVKVVINYGITFDILEYAQQSGRGGRDGEPCLCLLLYTNKDFVMKKFMIRNSKGNWNERLSDLNEIQEFGELEQGKHSNYLKEYFN